MWSQFKDDVFHTEEMQIIDTIKLEVLMNRILRAQHENQEQIQALGRVLQNEKQLPRDERDTELIINLERQIAVTRAEKGLETFENFRLSNKNILRQVTLPVELDGVFTGELIQVGGSLSPVL